MTEKIKDKVNLYYTDKANTHGATSMGVDWNGPESHHLRFTQLLKLLKENEACSLLDFGCGYGELLDLINFEWPKAKYYGFDISKKMIELAQSKFPLHKDCFYEKLEYSQSFDYVLANGIFNVKLETEVDEWIQYIQNTLTNIDRRASKGFSFNILTSYSDQDKQRPHLYYADPLFWFQYCKTNFSKNVALLHDYDLYEFTLIIRK